MAQGLRTNPLRQLEHLGQSIWLDDLRRSWIEDGTLARLIAQDGITGITSNPAIFEKAITQHHDYDTDIADLRQQGLSGVALYESLVIDDIQRAADLLRGVYGRSATREGYVSLEVSPRLADDTQATLAEAQRLWDRVARPNLMIKVPATPAGLPAIRELIAGGINVNVTLLFSAERYRAVAETYLAGLESRVSTGRSVSHIASVASFFVSRIDTLVDRELDLLGITASPWRGRAAVDCAHRAYRGYLQIVSSARWRSLAEKSAYPQRLLWASTSTKNKSYRDVKYVEELVACDTVTTLSVDTLAAYRDHGQPSLRIAEQSASESTLPTSLGDLGIDLNVIARQLERDGVRDFVDRYDHLVAWLSATDRDGRARR